MKLSYGIGNWLTIKSFYFHKTASLLYLVPKKGIIKDDMALPFWSGEHLKKERV